MSLKSEKITYQELKNTTNLEDFVVFRGVQLHGPAELASTVLTASEIMVGSQARHDLYNVVKHLNDEQERHGTTFQIIDMNKRVRLIVPHNLD